MSNVANFQNESGLYPDGIIGPLTTEKMRQKWGATKIQLAHFLGQCHVETGGFIYSQENLNYSAQGLLAIFPKYFTPAMAEKYAYNPEMIANIAYSDRMGNGDLCSGDGYKFRGRGSIQLTGRTNYENMSQWIGENLTDHPDEVAGKYFWLSGIFYFNINSVWRLCSSLTDAAIRNVTIRVNGGTTAFEERKRWTNYYHKIQT